MDIDAVNCSIVDCKAVATTAKEGIPLCEICRMKATPYCRQCASTNIDLQDLGCWNCGGIDIALPRIDIHQKKKQARPVRAG